MPSRKLPELSAWTYLKLLHEFEAALVTEVNHAQFVLDELKDHLSYFYVEESFLAFIDSLSLWEVITFGETKKSLFRGRSTSFGTGRGHLQSPRKPINMTQEVVLGKLKAVTDKLVKFINAPANQTEPLKEPLEMLQTLCESYVNLEKMIRVLPNDDAQAWLSFYLISGYRRPDMPPLLWREDNPRANFHLILMNQPYHAQLIGFYHLTQALQHQLCPALYTPIPLIYVEAKPLAWYRHASNPAVLYKEVRVESCTTTEVEFNSLLAQLIIQGLLKDYLKHPLLNVVLCPYLIAIKDKTFAFSMLPRAFSIGEKQMDTLKTFYDHFKKVIARNKSKPIPEAFLRSLQSMDSMTLVFTVANYLQDQINLANQLEGFNYYLPELCYENLKKQWDSLQFLFGLETPTLRDLAHWVYPGSMIKSSAPSRPLKRSSSLVLPPKKTPHKNNLAVQSYSEAKSSVDNRFDLTLQDDMSIHWPERPISHEMSKALARVVKTNFEKMASLSDEKQQHVLDDLYSLGGTPILSFTGCRVLTDRYLKNYAKRYGWCVETLTIIDCPQVTAAGVSAFVIANPNILLELSLSGRMMVEDLWRLATLADLHAVIDETRYPIIRGKSELLHAFIKAGCHATWLSLLLKPALQLEINYQEHSVPEAHGLGYSALHWAVLKGDLPALECLLNYHPDLTVQATIALTRYEPQYRSTQLGSRVHRGSNAEALVVTRPKGGVTPLELALENKQLDAATRLVNLTERVDGKNKPELLRQLQPYLTISRLVLVDKKLEMDEFADLVEAGKGTITRYCVMGTEFDSHLMKTFCETCDDALTLEMNSAQMRALKLISVSKYGRVKLLKSAPEQHVKCELAAISVQDFKDVDPDAVLACIAASEGLRRVSFKKAKLSPEHVNDLVEHLLNQKLRHVEALDFQQLQFEAPSLLRECDRRALRRRLLLSVKACSQLQTLNFENADLEGKALIDELCVVIEALPRLRHLNLTNAGLDTDSLWQLIDLLNNLSRPIYVSLKGYAIEDPDLKFAIHANPYLDHDVISASYGLAHQERPLAVRHQINRLEKLPEQLLNTHIKIQVGIARVRAHPEKFKFADLFEKLYKVYGRLYLTHLRRHKPINLTAHDIENACQQLETLRKRAVVKKERLMHEAGATLRGMKPNRRHFRRHNRGRSLQATSALELQRISPRALSDDEKQGIEELEHAFYCLDTTIALSESLIMLALEIKEGKFPYKSIEAHYQQIKREATTLTQWTIAYGKYCEDLTRLGLESGEHTTFEALFKSYQNPAQTVKNFYDVQAQWVSREEIKMLATQVNRDKKCLAKLKYLVSNRMDCPTTQEFCERLETWFKIMPSFMAPDKHLAQRFLLHDFYRAPTSHALPTLLEESEQKVVREPTLVDMSALVEIPLDSDSESHQPTTRGLSRTR